MGSDPRTLSKYVQHSGYSSRDLQQTSSVIDLEKKSKKIFYIMNFIHLFFLSLLDDETNRTYTELKAISTQCFVLPCDNLQCDPTNVETQIINPIPST